MAPRKQTPNRKTNPSTRNTAVFKKNRRRILEGAPPCHWCNTRTATTADHLIEEDRWPEQTPGLNELDNLVAACKPCNSSRGARYRNIKHSKQNTAPDKNEKINTNTHNYTNSFFTDQQKPPHDSLDLSKTASSSQLGLVTADRVSFPADLVRSSAIPRLETSTGAYAFSYGDEIAAWSFEHLGIEFMDWQKHIANNLFIADADGNFLHRQGCLSVARQNGKSTLASAVLGWFATDLAKRRGKPQTIISTAHRLDLAYEMFLKLAPIFESKFSGVVTWSLGRNQVEFPDGTRWIVRAATNTVGHGLAAVDLVYVDELWAVSSDAVSLGLMPTQRTAHSPLMFMTSTAGDESSVEFLKWREQGLRIIDSKQRGKLYFAEYSPKNTVDPMSVSAWHAANPAICGGTISLEVLQAEAEQPNRAAFIRSSVNLWLASSNSWLNDPGVWDTLQTAEPMPNGGVLAVEVSQDDSRYVGLRGAMNSEGKCQVAVVFVKDTLQDCLAAIELEIKDSTTRLLVTPSLELSMPAKLVSRTLVVGNRELIRWTALARNAILEGKVAHDGSTLLAQHVGRAVSVKVQGAISLSSIRSPGPIELCRCLVWVLAMASKPVTTRKPLIFVANG